MTDRLWTALAFAVCVVASVMLGYFTGWVRGFRRGRDVQAMEPPKQGGVLHFRDGLIWSVPALSASGAIACVTSTRWNPWCRRVPTREQSA